MHLIIVGILSLASASNEAPVHLKNLSGCFNVSYRFVEDGTHDYEIKSALEKIVVTAKDEKTFTVQHWGYQENTWMKHFYEEWTPISEGQWRQQIFGPSGNYRYTCESPLRFGQMRCTSLACPKPVRDFDRKDYDVLNRNSNIQITPKGFVQNEVNDKLKGGNVIATEVGWVEYRRVDDKECQK